MLVPARRLILTLAVLAVAALPGHAQTPSMGEYFTDKGDLGFKVRVPEKWDLIPPQPDESDIIAKFVPSNQKYVLLSPDKPLFWMCWLVKFDRRPKPEGDAEGKKEGASRFVSPAAKDITAWLKDNVDDGKKLKLDSQKDFTSQKIAATEYQYSTPDEPKLRVSYYVAVYKLSPEVEVALVFNAPGDPKKWHKWKGIFTQMARSFGTVDLKEIAGATATGTTLRDKVRAEQYRKLGSHGKWALYETANYFVITDHQDKAFIEELKLRLERIREIYEQDYPAAKADEYKKLGETLKTGERGSDEDEAKAAAEKAFREMLTEGGDPKELSRCSIVRVFTDQDAYYAYGGRPGTAGYWTPVFKELVLYDDQKGGRRADTWAVLNHEAFHQYIFYFFGAISPHSWYNEGTGDFYSGYAWKINKFVLEKFQWRIGTIKSAIQAKKHVPLDQFVRFTQEEYYYTNKFGVDGGQNYAQGWALIYFLRTGKKNNAKGWDPAWDNILETYLRVLASTDKLDLAVDEAFKGIDMQALEKAWMDYIN